MQLVLVGVMALAIVVMGVWFLRGFYRRHPNEDPPTKFAPWSALYFSHAELDGRWFSSMSSFRRRAHSVLRAGRKLGKAGQNAAVGTIAVQFDALLFWVTRQTIALRTSEHDVELVARGFLDWPWQMVPIAPRYEVTVDGAAIGTLDIGHEEIIARDAGGEVARWWTGAPIGSVLQGDKPKYGGLSGKATGSLRVPLRRVTDGRYLDFGGVPFYASAEGDERWLLAFLALATQASLLIQSRSPMNPRPLNPR